MSPKTSEERVQVALENRKLRNRLSQKAFRARQSIRIKELEDILATRPLSETDRITELEGRIQSLLDQLMMYHKKLESMQISLKTLTDATAVSLGMNSTACHASISNSTSISDTEKTTRDRQFVSSPDSSEKLKHRGEINTNFILADEDLSSITLYNAVESLGHLEELSEEQPSGVVSLTQTAISCPRSFDQFDFFNDPVFQASSWPMFNENNPVYATSRLTTPFSFPDMGPAAFQDAVAKGPILASCSYGQLRRTNSVFSDHFNAVEYFLQQKLTSSEASWDTRDESLQKAVSFMLSVFVCLSWQKMTPWHTWTAGNFGAGKLMIWRLNPTEASFAKLPAHYRPTQTQLSIPHPTVIDWISWPEIRDKLIRYHSANPCLDDIIREIGNCYVVETDLSRLVAARGPVMGFVGVWDIVRAISPEATLDNSSPSRDFNQTFDSSYGQDVQWGESLSSGSITESYEYIDGTCTLPAPNLSSLFGSKTLATQAFQLLKMEKAENLRLHPAFFENHPEFADCRNLMARGVSLKPRHHVSMPSPRALGTNVLGMYREFTTQISRYL